MKTDYTRVCSCFHLRISCKQLRKNDFYSKNTKITLHFGKYISFHLVCLSKLRLFATKAYSTVAIELQPFINFNSVYIITFNGNITHSCSLFPTLNHFYSISNNIFASITQMVSVKWVFHLVCFTSLRTVIHDANIWFRVKYGQKIKPSWRQCANAKGKEKKTQLKRFFASNVRTIFDRLLSSHDATFERFFFVMTNSHSFSCE